MHASVFIFVELRHRQPGDSQFWRIICQKMMYQYRKSSVIILVYTVVYKIVLLFLGTIVLLTHFEFVTQSRVTIGLFILGIKVNVIIIMVCLLCMYSTKVVQGIVVKTIHLLARLHIVKGPERKIHTFYLLLDDYHESA